MTKIYLKNGNEIKNNGKILTINRNNKLFDKVFIGNQITKKILHKLKNSYETKELKNETENVQLMQFYLKLLIFLNGV